MSLSDKIKNAKESDSLFADIPATRKAALRKSVDIARSIRRERKKRGMNQTEFAQLCGVSQAAVSKWESGETNFTILAWAELSHLLHIPFDPASDTFSAPSSPTTYMAAVSKPSVYRPPNIVDFTHYRAAHLPPKEN